jgi:hypothetical protein
MSDVTLDEADVRILLQLIVYLDHVIDRDGVITADSWSKQVGETEREAVQHLIDTVRL